VAGQPKRCSEWQHTTAHGTLPNRHLKAEDGGSARQSCDVPGTRAQPLTIKHIVSLMVAHGCAKRRALPRIRGPREGSTA